MSYDVLVLICYFPLLEQWNLDNKITGWVSVILCPDFACWKHSDSGRWRRRVQRRRHQCRCLRVRRRVRMGALHRVARRPTRRRHTLCQIPTPTATATCRAITLQLHQLHMTQILKYADYILLTLIAINPVTRVHLEPVGSRVSCSPSRKELRYWARWQLFARIVSCIVGWCPVDSFLVLKHVAAFI